MYQYLGTIPCFRYRGNEPGIHSENGSHSAPCSWGTSLAPVVPDDCARDTTSKDQITLSESSNSLAHHGPHPGTFVNWILRGGSCVCAKASGSQTVRSGSGTGS